MFNNPSLITLTGADDNSEISQFVQFGKNNRVEFGILYSGKIKPRYPSIEWIHEFVRECEAHHVSVAIHLCGKPALRVAQGEGDTIGMIQSVLEVPFVNRIQINFSEDELNIDSLNNCAQFASRFGLHKRAILQWRDPLRWPKHNEVDWLYDRSGGRGVLQEYWPQHPGDIRCGYAGGLDPSNVQAAIERMHVVDNQYWIDAETGLRDSENNFSLKLCADFVAAASR